MKVNYIGVNRLKSVSHRINMAIEKTKPVKPVSPPVLEYMVLDKGKLDINKLK